MQVVPGPIDGYADSREHLFDELRRIDLLIQHKVDQFRAAGRDPDDAFRGLHISHQDVDDLLARSSTVTVGALRRSQEVEKGRAPLLRRIGRSNPAQNGNSPAAIYPAIPDPIARRYQALEANIVERKAASLAQAVELRLESLTARFGLGDFERDALLVCLAPELDLKYERLYAYLQDDVTRKRPTVDLVLRLLYLVYGDKSAGRAAFTLESPLVHYHLVEISGETQESPAPLLARPLKVDDRIVDYLLGRDSLDTRLRSILRWAEPRATWQDLSLTEGTKQGLIGLTDWYRTRVGDKSPNSLILFLCGPENADKQAAAEAVCRQVGAWLLVVNLLELLRDEIALENTMRLIFREAVLQQVPLYWNGFELLLSDEARSRRCRNLLFEQLESLTGLTFIASEAEWEPAGVLHGKVCVGIQCLLPSYAARRALWESLLRDQTAEPIDLGTLANQFLFGPTQIRDAVAAARNRALWRNPGEAMITLDDLFAACRALSNHQLASLAHPIQPVYGWDDIVLPPDPLSQLREICHAVRYRPVVHDEWGFEHKLSRGKGVNALFTGQSGTGKTMATEIIARDLGLDLYKIDLSSVVSKYVGETEKNLERIFQEAHMSNAILFFDEADALFGKRSEVKDAHDRYANIEIAYLLQRMEEYDGIVILATNMKKNMDEAFVRRLQFTIDFPFPEEPDRLHIWQKIWPDETPLGADMDLGFMARQFKLAGGNIKNIALAAAFLAAADGRTVTMAHLVQATKREYQKMGKLCSQAEFGPYFHLIQA